jgi:Ca-activated chloride channel family protein
MFGYEFANPEYFWLLLVLIPMVIWYIFKEKRSHADLKFSSIRVFKQMKRGSRIWLRHLLFAARVLAILFLVLALARPQSSSSWQTYNSEGIDIMLALDISGSMLARDFTPDRLEAAKEVATKFILERPQDRIGLVVFSGESFTQSPLTTDQAVLVNVMKDIHSGMIEDGTAIGLGLANAVNRLKDSKAQDTSHKEDGHQHSCHGYVSMHVHSDVWYSGLHDRGRNFR